MRVLIVDLFTSDETTSISFPLELDEKRAIALTRLLELQSLSHGYLTCTFFLADKAKFAYMTSLSSTNSVLFKLHLVLVRHLIVRLDSLFLCAEKVRKVAYVNIGCRIGARRNIVCLSALGQPIVPLRNIVSLICL